MDNIKMNAAGTGVQMKCTACGAALYFDPLSGQMKCAYCGQDGSKNKNVYDNKTVYYYFRAADTFSKTLRLMHQCSLMIDHHVFLNLISFFRA